MADDPLSGHEQALVNAVAQSTAEKVQQNMPTRDEIKKAIEDGVVETMTGLVLKIGIDINDPEEVKQLKRDFAYIRASRERWETIIKHGLMSAVGLIVLGIMSALWIAIKGAGK